MRRRNKVLNSWENMHVLKCELDDAVVRKAKQKRRAPPVPSVNQLAWSQDDLLVRTPSFPPAHSHTACPAAQSPTVACLIPCVA